MCGLAGALAACHGAPSDPPGDGPADTSAPTTDTDAPTGPAIRDVTATRAENPDLYLAWQLALSADRPVRATLEWTGGDDHRRVAFTAFAAEQTLPVLGLLASTAYTLTVTATDDAGATATATLAFETEALPTPFPVLEPLMFDPARIAPGYTLLDAKRDDELIHLVALDPALRPAWVFARQHNLTDARFDGAGNVWMLADEGVVVRDLLGRGVHQWGGDPVVAPYTAISVGNPNHELLPDGLGGFWTFGDQSTEVAAYPTSYAEPTALGGPAELRDPRVLHLGADGAVLTAWALSERLQTTRISFDALDYSGSLRDWGHANSLCPDGDGGWLVGVRHQDAVIDLDADGNLRWILGDPAGWDAAFAPYLLTPVGADFAWPYHAHGACVETDGTVALLDNNNDGHTPYTAPPADFSPITRARGYRVDAAAHTVALAWTYEQTATGPLSVQAIGDADLLANGDVLADFGWVEAENGASNGELGWGSRSTRLVEWTPDGALALDLRMRSDQAEIPGGWGSYRAERVPSLYPTEGDWEAVETRLGR